MLKVLIFFSFAGDLAAQTTKYWARDSVLRNDPSLEGQIQSRVFEGAPFDVLSCNAQGWCYGRVYGHDEGWAKASDLIDIQLQDEKRRSFFDESERPRDGAKVHHLQDYRSSYAFAGLASGIGTGNLSTQDERLLKKQSSYFFSAGWGRYLSQQDNHRWSGELSLSIQNMASKVAFVDKNTVISFTSVKLGLGLLKIAPYSPTYGFGLRTRIYFDLTRNANPDFGDAPPFYTFQGSMVVSHGVGALKKPERIEWDASVYLNHRQFILGLGLNFIF